jgi:hypothetical protein
MMILIVPLASWWMFHTNSPRESDQVLSHVGCDDHLPVDSQSGSGPGDPEDYVSSLYPQGLQSWAV